MEASLLRFYGGLSPTGQSWRDTPVDTAMACLDMIPVIKAREALAATTVVAMGSGAVPKDHARDVEREWRRQAGWLRVTKPKTREELVKMARDAGIGVRFVKRRASHGS